MCIRLLVEGPRTVLDDRGKPALAVSDLLGIGSLNVGCLVAGLALGWWLDAQAATTPVLTLLGLAAGVALGVALSWRRLRPLLREVAGTAGGSSFGDAAQPGTDRPPGANGAPTRDHDRDDGQGPGHG